MYAIPSSLVSLDLSNSRASLLVDVRSSEWGLAEMSGAVRVAMFFASNRFEAQLAVVYIY